MKHRCHLPGCKTSCPEAWLFCAHHWRMVPRKLQQEVRDAVRIRGYHIDASWAPWWRAQAKATAAVLTKLGVVASEVERWQEQEMKFATRLEERRVNDKRPQDPGNSQ